MARALKQHLRVLPGPAEEAAQSSRGGRLPLPDGYGKDESFIQELIDPILRFLFEKWFRVQVSGLENVPADGRVLLVGNHSGALPWDALMIYEALRTRMERPRQVRFLVDKFVMRLPFVSMAAMRGGFVLACRENARRLLLEDELVGVFPEGTKGVGKLWRERYRLARFGRGGFVELALETGSPVLPVSVVGAEETHPILYKPDWLARALNVPYVPITPTLPWLGLFGLVPIPSKFYIHFDKPLRFKPAARARAHDFTIVNEVNRVIRARIQRGIDIQLARRPGVF